MTNQEIAQRLRETAVANKYWAAYIALPKAAKDRIYRDWPDGQMLTFDQARLYLLFVAESLDA